MCGFESNCSHSNLHLCFEQQRSSLTSRQPESVDLLQNMYVTWYEHTVKLQFQLKMYWNIDFLLLSVTFSFTVSKKVRTMFSLFEEACSRDLNGLKSKIFPKPRWDAPRPYPSAKFKLASLNLLRILPYLLICLHSVKFDLRKYSYSFFISSC